VNEHLPVVSGAQLVAALTQRGWAQVRQRGSHVILATGADHRRLLVVPLHRELKRGTLAAILRDAGMAPGELRALL
jgi:predicted RNA binding protein YcfA (HicA-like mRNA interferase family)